ncbi:hypothetical protein BTVI_139997 [Pitangus sulphuratus]|nr:hypothetical protein BTVI_139997 [Pitangus sulphuratus]
MEVHGRAEIHLDREGPHTEVDECAQRRLRPCEKPMLMQAVPEGHPILCDRIIEPVTTLQILQVKKRLIVAKSQQTCMVPYIHHPECLSSPEAPVGNSWYLGGFVKLQKTAKEDEYLEDTFLSISSSLDNATPLTPSSPTDTLTNWPDTCPAKCAPPVAAEFTYT